MDCQSLVLRVMILVRKFSIGENQMHMKKCILAIVAITLAIGVSCKREEQQVNPPVDISEESFLATIDNGSNPDSVPKVDDDMTTMTTITTINNTKIVNWEAGDIIYVNGKAYVTSTSGESVIFSPVNANDPATGDNFVAFYGIKSPASNSATAVLPATQTYVGGKVSNLPMYAICGSERVLTFHNICAALRITVPVNCVRIKLTASEPLSGGFAMSADTAKPVAILSSGDTHNYVEIVKSSGEFVAGEEIYLAVPQGNYTNAQIMFIDNDSVIKESKEIGSFTTIANKVYKVSVTPYPELCFTALEKTTIEMTRVSNGSTNFFIQLEFCKYNPNAEAGSRLGQWIHLVENGWNRSNNVTIFPGEKLYIRATGTNTALALDTQNYCKFTSTGKVTVSGNIMYLLNSSSPANVLYSANNYAFYKLFQGMTTLKDASELILPATTLSNHCYTSMFIGCTGLTSAPELPATTLADFCYASMFYGCTNLTNAPALPATTLTDFCYASMFNNCTKLENVPVLPATQLRSNCYNQMFYNCLRITTAPELPATILSDNCYQLMFSCCSLLVNAPELPAATLADYCYNQMFVGCSNLSSVTMKATNISANACLNSWLNGAGTSATDTRTVHCKSSIRDDIQERYLPNGWTAVGDVP